MTLRTSALALVAAGALFLPSAAEASHRHSRSCRHDSRHERSYRHDRYDGYRGRSYNRHYYAPRSAYRYYAPRPVYRYYAPPPPVYYYDDYGYDDGYGYDPSYRYHREPSISLHYHSGRPCRRFHVGLNLRF